MNKFIPILALVVLVVGGVMYYMFSNSSKPPITSTTSTQIITTTVLPKSTLPSTTTIPYVSKNTSCVTGAATVPIPNGNFSTGTYANWTVNGLGFGKIPFNITKADEYNEYYGQPWTGYNGTYFATSYNVGTTVVIGNLTSQSFLLREPYINFKVISPQNNLLYIELLKGGVPQVTVHYNTFAVPIKNTTNSTNAFDSSSNFFNASLIAAPLLCSNVQIKIVAQVVGTLGNQFNYIAATNFYQSKQPFSTPGIILNQTLNFT